MRRLDIRHVTEYLFSARVSLLPHQLLLRPRENHNERIESSILFAKYTIQWKRDVPDNSVALLSFTESSTRLRIDSAVVIQHHEDNPLDFLVDDYAVVHPFGVARESRCKDPPVRPSPGHGDTLTRQSLWV